MKLFAKFILNMIDIFIVRAHNLKFQFQGLVPEHKFRVVYIGIDTSEFDKDYVSKTTSDVVNILFVGYLSKAKGATNLVEAIPSVVSKEDNVHFIMAGSKLEVERNITFISNPRNNEEEILQIIQENDISKYIDFPGVIIGQKKIKTFLEADIFILPSYSEAFPVVVLEAMASGLPVITTPVGALPEVFTEENILFIQPGDIDGIAERLLQLIKDPLLRDKMGALNKKIVRERFHLDNYAEQLSKVFDEFNSFGRKQ